MADGRRNNGGKREGAGRKSKCDELKLIEKLTPLDDVAFGVLQQGLENGNYKFWETFMHYRYGKPQTKVDITTGGEKFNLPLTEFFTSEEPEEDLDI